MWVKIDDSLDGHPKFLQAWDAAPASVGLWPQALAWAGRHLTDGHVSAEYVLGRTSSRRQRDQLTGALVESQLWVPNGSGWQIHDFTDFNPSRAQVEARRQLDAVRKRR